MSNLLETSFIPQQPLLKVEASARRHEPVNLALVVALVFFFTSLAVGGGLFFYKQQVEKRIAIKKIELANIEKTFNLDQINSYKHLQSSLAVAKGLVDDHAIFSVILNMLEARTAMNVGLTSLSYSSDGKEIVLSIAGQAPSYSAVYFQTESMRQYRPFIKSVEVSGLSLNEQSGIVSFSYKIIVDGEYLRSSRVIAEAQLTPPLPAVKPAADISPLSATTTPSAPSFLKLPSFHATP